MLAIALTEKDIQRFWSKVDRRSDSECWIWKAGITDGYGQFHIGKKNTSSHIVSYALLKGDCPDGLELDHLCRNRACCNPAHLEPVTHQVNVLRGKVMEVCGKKNSAKTHCPHGHEYTPENTYYTFRARGVRIRNCKECHRQQARRYKACKRHSLTLTPPCS